MMLTLSGAGRVALAAVISCTLGGCALFQATPPTASVETKPAAPAQLRPSGKQRRLIAEAVAREARKQGVPEDLALAVAKVESSFNPMARSSAGAVGVMQILPRTARSLGHRGSIRDLFRPEVNIRYGVAYLRQGFLEAGPRWAVLRYHGGPNTRIHGPRTQGYATKVLAFANLPADGWIERGTVQLAMADVATAARFVQQ